MTTASIQRERRRAQAEYDQACAKAASLEERAKAIRAEAKTSLKVALEVLDRLDSAAGKERGDGPVIEQLKKDGVMVTDRPALIDAVREAVKGMDRDFNVKDVKLAVLKKYPSLSSTHQSSWPKAVGVLREAGEIAQVREAAGKRGATYRYGLGGSLKFDGIGSEPETGAR